MSQESHSASKESDSPAKDGDQKKKEQPQNNVNNRKRKAEKEIFRYGNYSRYYGYRNAEPFEDVRLDVFLEHLDLFHDKDVLDIGCNSGMLTTEVAKKLPIKSITGIDIDANLVNRAQHLIQKLRKESTERTEGFPFNISFVKGNYVLKDDVLLEIEEPQFDTILCLSVTKWIHLNFGDAGLKQAFRRMFLQLRPGGKLILEPQPWEGYKRRKKLTSEIFENYKNIKFFPKDFNDYLLGPEVGFAECTPLGIPDHCIKGFKRPIQVFVKR